MNLTDILFIAKSHGIKPDASLSDILLAKKLDEGVIRTIKGNPLRFSARKAQKAKNPSLTLLPIQDLHGYDKPWVGGMGKNLLPMAVTIPNVGDTYTNKQVTFTNIGGGKIKINGTANGDGYFYITKYNTTGDDDLHLPAGSYKLKTNIIAGEPQTNTYRVQLSIYDSSHVWRRAAYSYNETPTSFTINEGETEAVYMWFPSGKVFNNFIFEFMITSGSETDMSFAPYENLCPISGREDAEVVRCGKNLLEIVDGVDKTSSTGNVTIKTANHGEITLNGSMSANPSVAIWNLAVLNSTSTPQSDNKKHLPNGTYKCTNLVPGMRIQIMGSDAENADITNTTAISSFYVGRETLTLNTNFKYTWLRLYLEENATFNNVTFAPMIYQTDYPDSTYAPYTGQTITFTFGQTVYGGTIDFDTGVLTVDHMCKTFDGTENISKISSGANLFYRFVSDVNFPSVSNNKYACSHFENAEVITSTTVLGCYAYYSSSQQESYIQFRVNIDGVTDATTFKTWLQGQYNNGTPVQVFSKLRTPTTIQLTPQEINLLKGINNIWTDGDTIELTYKA